MTTPSAPVAAGWYPDPWNAAPQRYWDGAQWTGHVAGATSRVALSAARSQSSRKMARWGLITVAATQVLIVVTFTFLLTGFATFDFASSTSANGSDTGPSALGGVFLVIGFIASIPLQFTPYVAIILLLIWTYRIAQDAAGLGIPARRSPGWAIGGWLIPIVNLWFPYESICDALPRERRPKILRWWLLYILGSAAPAVLGVVALPFIFTGIPALVFVIGFIGLIVISVLQVLQLRWGFEVADQIDEGHRSIAQESGLLTA